MVTRIKICGLKRREDVELAIELGANALGFVFEPASPRYAGAEPSIPDLVADLPPFVQSVAVFGNYQYSPLLGTFGAIQAFDLSAQRLDLVLTDLRQCV